MLTAVSRLCEQLEARQVRYCHWKSNWALATSVNGRTDFDLLVRRRDARALREILEGLGFRPAIEPGADPFPSVEHYHALDEESGSLVHVHAYYRVISGGSLTKNYHLPVEEMLLENVRRESAVNVPSRGAELIVFVLRMSLKHATLPELALVRREAGSMQLEADWLATTDARAEAAGLLRAWLPSFDPKLFEEALEALRKPASICRRVSLGRRVQAQLRSFARRGRFAASVAGASKLTGKATHRLTGSPRRLAPATGGAVVAFVGSEATGKSTMLEDTAGWLGAHYTVRRVHAGKPPATPLTFVPNLLLPALRRIAPEQRSTVVAARQAPDRETASATEPFPLLFGIRSVLLAHDRRALLTRAFADAANGTIVLSDRYPSSERGATDGAQLRQAASGATDGRLRRWLVEREARLYRDIPDPDLVIHLTAPIDVTLERNRARAKKEPEDYVRVRHARSSNPTYERAPVSRVDTDQPAVESVREIRRIIWEAL